MKRSFAVSFAALAAVAMTGAAQAQDNAAEIDELEPAVDTSAEVIADPVDDQAGKLHGAIQLTERLGAETIVEVKLKDGEPLIAALSEDRIYEPGERIGFDFDTERAQLFPPED